MSDYKQRRRIAQQKYVVIYYYSIVFNFKYIYVFKIAVPTIRYLSTNISTVKYMLFLILSQN